MYEEGDIADGPNGPMIFTGGRWVPIAAAQPQRGPQGFTIGTPDPLKGQMQQAQYDKLRQEVAQSQQKFAERDVPTGYRMRADGTGVEPIPGGPNDPSVLQAVNAPKLTAKERADAIAGYTSAQHLDEKIRLIEQRYKAGPGSTSGIGGLMDYLPLTANQQFDAAGNAARGFAKQALGFTGGENNTARESEVNLGPYIPQAGDRDATILDKINQLKDLSAQARERSIAILGGIPDANGVIKPVASQKVDATPVPPASDFAGVQTVANGGTKTERDPKREAALNALIRGNADINTINATMIGMGGTPVDEGQINAARAFLRKNPGYKGSLASATNTTPTSFRERVAGSAAGAFTANALNDAAAGIPGAAFGTDNLKLQQQAYPDATAAGSLLGGVVGASGLELGLGAGAARVGGGALSRFLSSPVTADAVYGGVQGATTAGTPTGAAVGAGAGVAGGMFGRGFTRAAGSAFRGVTDPGVRYLADRNVPLTVGQTLGGVAKGIEDRLAGVPFVGDAIRARRLEGIREFNRTAFDQGLSNIGASTGGTIGEEGIDLARSARSQAYRNALDPVRLAPDTQFGQDIAAARSQASLLPADMAERGRYALDRALENGPTQLDGNGFQQAVRRFRRTTTQNAPLPNGDDLGNVMRGAEDAFTGLLARQSPGSLADFNAANAANRNVEVLRSAVNAARNGTRTGETGLFAPSQLSDAAAANARKFGNTAGTTQQPFFDLSRAGQQVLPSQVPDSGTAGRLAVLALPAALGGTGAGLGYAGGDTSAGTYTGLGLGAALTLGGSRAAQRAATRALLDRPDAFVRIGDRIYNRARLGGMFGAGLGASGASLIAPDF